LCDNEVYSAFQSSIEFAKQRRFWPVSETRDAKRFAVSEDRRMWRLLLARLHPDAGGDHDLFAFACAMRDEMSGARSTAKDTEEKDGARSTKRVATPFFLRAWQDAMVDWSSGNRNALKNLRTR
jgi:hypothetical protein